MPQTKTSINDFANSACWASQVVQWVKNLPTMQEHARGMGSIPGLGRFSWSREHYSCLENPMHRAHTAQYEHDRTSVIICTEPTLELCEMRTLQFHYT